ncbi:hypothetical protein P3T23_009735, partial [Paraburkholderia sp. GAS448]|uniref:hypothetical protein n=1 Tax=Paraburkholderia sp. GAS448 TaxID=3035136 RepID=UPI003D1D7D2E
AGVTGAVHSGQSSTITAARDVALDGGLEVDGTGDATVNAGRDLTGSGTVSVANNTTFTAGGRPCSPICRASLEAISRRARSAIT